MWTPCLLIAIDALIPQIPVDNAAIDGADGYSPVCLRISRHQRIGISVLIDAILRSEIRDAPHFSI